MARVGPQRHRKKRILISITIRIQALRDVFIQIHNYFNNYTFSKAQKLVP